MDELINEMYSTNADFKQYVDKYAVSNHVTVDVALTHAEVKNYGEYLIDRGETEPALRNLWKNDEDKGC